MQDIINNLPKLAKDKHNETKKFFAKLKKKPPKNLNYIMQELHEEEFERTDCLEFTMCDQKHVENFRIPIEKSFSKYLISL